MIYTIIISLLIEKPFYLLRPQSFSFQIVSEFIDTFVKFSNFMSQGWGFWLPVLSWGEGFCTQWLSLGEGFVPFKSCPGGGGMVLDEIDTCIITCFPSMLGYFPVCLSRCHHVSQSPWVNKSLSTLFLLGEQIILTFVYCLQIFCTPKIKMHQNF